MDQKALLRQLWEIQARNRNGGTKPACKLQLLSPAGPIEYLVCPSALMLDYRPAPIKEIGTLFPIDGLPLKKLDDISKINPDVFLSEESLVINRELTLTDHFVPLKNKNGEHGLGLFDAIDDKLILKDILPFSKDGCFQFAGLAIFNIPAEVLTEINNNSSIIGLHGRICKVRTNPWMAVVLSCDTGMLVVTLQKTKPTNPENENIYFDKECQERYRLDGYQDEGGFFTRLVKANKQMPVKGLACPVQRNKPTEAAAAPVTPPTPEPQVEEVQPAQAEEIAQAAPEAQPVQEAVQSGVEPDPAETQETPKKRTRTPRKQQVPKDYDGPFFGLNTKAIDDLIAYLASPVPEQMSVEGMQEESRKLRDLGVVLARRQSNLLVAATASEKKLRDVLKGVLG